VKKAGYVLFVFIVSLTVLAAQSDLRKWDRLLESSGYQDNWSVRLAMEDKLTAHPSAQRELPIEIVESTEPGTPSVKFEFRDMGQAYYILFINRNIYNYYFEERVRYEEVDTLGRGNWIIKRDPLDGRYIQAKVYLQDKEESSYMMLTSGQDRSYLDIYLYGKILYRHVPIGLSFDQILISPMARILHLTSDAVDWESIFTDASYQEWRAMENVVQAIEPRLDSLDYVDDGAMDYRGNWVFIDDLEPQPGTNGVNCSGFMKWVADGFYQARPYRDDENYLMSIEELKEAPPVEQPFTHSWNENFSDRDPYFGLIWTRNIAEKLWEALTGLESRPNQQDLNRIPFFEYRENIGYELEDLESLLYLAAVQEPGRIYWAAVNSQFQPGGGHEQVLWQYYHVFVAIPWFDERGEFHYRIYESGRKGSLEGLMNEYPDSWVHLTANAGWMGFLPVRVNPAVLDLLGY